jgi:hypothetical protein
MNIQKLAIYFCFSFLLVLFQNCKDNAVITPPPNNTQTPTGPVLNSPPNETTTQAVSPILVWNSFEGAVNYRVQVSLDANFSGTVVTDTNGVTTTQLQVPANLITTGIYFYWRVIANISGGVSPWSTTWRFRVILAPPAAPTLLLPTNASTNQPFLPLFDWDDVPTAQYYKIQISGNSSFTNILLDSGAITESQLQCPPYILNTSTQYFWRVNASNSNGVSIGPYSSAFSFTTVAGPRPNSISGQITFVDTNFIPGTSNRYYVGAYPQWPPNFYGPVETDTVQIFHSGNSYYGTYTVGNLPNGNYVVAFFYFGLYSVLSAPILGIYGCDTVHVQFSNCPSNPNRVTINSNNGVENINLLGWADTTHRIY